MVHRAGQGPEEAAAGEAVVVAVEVTDGQQEEALGIAAHGRGATVRTGHGGLLPPLAADRAAEIEEAVALARSEVARAERKRSTHSGGET